MVVIGTFEWSSLRILHKVPLPDALVIVLVSAVTVFTDLAVAVVVGVIVSALVFAWKHAQHMTATSETNNGVKTYRISGSLFFGSTTEFLMLFDIANDPKEVVIDFAGSKVCDHSGLEAIDSLQERYDRNGKLMKVINLSDECEKIFIKAGRVVHTNA